MIMKLFDYTFGRLLTEEESNNIITVLDKQSDDFKVTDDFGDLSLSVYEMDFDNMSPSYAKSLLQDRINDFASKFGFEVRDLFFIKYEKDLIKMDPHYDGSSTTTLVYLNNNYTGGGTYFPFIKKTHVPQDHPVGHFIHYNSNHILSFHTGLPVTSGTKYVMVIRSLRINLLSVFYLLPYRIFRDLIFERFLLKIVFKNVGNR